MQFALRTSGRLLAAGLLLAGASAAEAAAISPTYEFLNPTGSANVMTTTGSATALTLPGQYTLANTFNTQQSTATNALIGTTNPPATPGVLYAFQDTYVFTLPAAAAGDLLTATLSLGNIFSISDLQVRLYGWSDTTLAGGPAPAATVGAIPSGPGGYVNAIGWQGFTTQPNQNLISLNFGVVPAGTYYLDIRGTATGTSGGSYVGQLNVAPVPLPAALPLLLSGLGLLGAARRRKAA
jgi:hypothetical protein